MSCLYDLNRPSFGTCLEFDNSTLDNLEFKTLESGLIYDILKNSDLSIDNLNVNDLFNFLQRDSEKDIADWIENFPLNNIRLFFDLIFFIKIKS